MIPEHIDERRREPETHLNHGDKEEDTQPGCGRSRGSASPITACEVGEAAAIRRSRNSQVTLDLSSQRRATLRRRLAREAVNQAEPCKPGGIILDTKLADEPLRWIETTGSEGPSTCSEGRQQAP